MERSRDERDINKERERERVRSHFDKLRIKLRTRASGGYDGIISSLSLHIVSSLRPREEKKIPSKIVCVATREIALSREISLELIKRTKNYKSTECTFVRDTEKISCDRN